MMRWIKSFPVGEWAVTGLVLVIALAALCLRLYHLDAHSLWDDELYSLGMVSLTGDWRGVVEPGKGLDVLEISDSFWTWKLADPHPPLYELLLALWIKLFGRSDFAVRSLSVVAGVGTVLLALALPRQLGKLPRIIFAALLATSGVLLVYSQEARDYILSAFLSVWLYVELARRLAQQQALPNNAWPSWRILLAAALLSLTHYYGALLVASVALVFTLHSAGHKGFLRSVAGWAVALLPLGVYVYFAWHGILTKMAAPTAITFTFGQSLLRLGYSMSELVFPGGWPTATVSAILAVGVLRRSFQARQISVAPVAQISLNLMLVLAVFLALMAVAVRKVEFFHPRYLIFVVPLCLLLIALASGTTGWLRVAMCGLVLVMIPWGIAGWQRVPMPQNGGDWRGAALYVAKVYEPGDIVISPSRPNRIQFAHYLSLQLGPRLDEYLLGVNDSQQLARELAARAQRPAKVIIYTNLAFVAINKDVETWLEGSYQCKLVDKQTYLSLQVAVMRCLP